MITAADIQTIRKADPGAVLPGIDTMTGNPYATSTLLDLTKITQNTNAPFYYSPSTNSVIVTQSGIVLRGINFGDATVYLEADNVTVEDCTFNGTLRQWAQGAIVKNNTFTGVQSPAGPWGGFIGSNPHITIENNTFLRAPGDAIDILGIPYWESITGGGLITGNYFSGAGYEPGAHADAIYVTDSSEPIAITDNLIDGTWSNDAPANSNSDIRITNEVGSVSNVTVSGNYLLGGGFTFEVWSSNTNYTISNISITNNDVGFDWYGQYYPGTPTLATVSGITTVDFSNPTDSTNALAAYVAAGVPTPIVISGTPGGAGETGTVPTTLLDGYAGAYLGAAGSGETNFVGGYGFQGLLGGQGANILTYLAIGDGGDRMSAFDPAKDVIDLSRIDADITTTGVQNFTFIGSAPFSGGAQVRYQFESDERHHHCPGRSRWRQFGRFYHHARRTRSAHGRQLRAYHVSVDGRSRERCGLDLLPVDDSGRRADGIHTYSNVRGRAYTTYEAFYGSGYENLEADDLNLSSKENTLVLYDPSQTVTRGGGTETLTVGAGSDPLAYHPIETIDATTSGSEQFIFSAGFGKETIDGFSASGASPDSIQLAKSAFSYLTAGMTQAEDLAAVMAHAARGASGLTITDTRDDSLTLAGITPSMVVANPAMVQFT